MLRDSIILSLESDSNLKAQSKRKDANGDLWQQVLLYYLEMDETKLVNMFNSGYLRYHCLCLINTKSVNYRHFGKHEKKQVYLEDINHDEQADTFEYNFGRDEQEHLLNHIIEQESVYDRELIKILFKGIELPNGETKKIKSLVELSQITGISYYTLRNSIIKFKKRAAEKIKHTTGKGWC